VVEWMLDGKVPSLSTREIEVLSLFAAGLPLKSVARRADISIETAKEYLSRIRTKYTMAGRPAGTKTELYYRGVEDGHIPLPTDRDRLDPVGGRHGHPELPGAG
jgi:DNA-binding CsgD family transcriptional regulator